MEDYYNNYGSQNQTYELSDYYENDIYENDIYDKDNDYKNIDFITYVLTCIIIAIGLPLTLVAIYALFSLLCYMIVKVAQLDVEIRNIFSSFYLSGLMASVGFMVCIALERYLVIVHPLWYRFRRTIKTSVVVCVLVWVLTLVCAVLFNLFYTKVVMYIIITVFFLPFPLLIFFLVATLKALPASISVPSDEKRRIVGILVLVLLIYTLLILPTIIWFLGDDFNKTLIKLSFMFVKLSPLADLVLYVFMRKGAIDKLLVSVVCCRMDSNQQSISLNDDIISTVSSN
ncbi:mas-related G-protein coupled receptor member A8-like isoform X2 [Micropterus dolomieu]|uniref:mas-related G-protein coupled receptor member A8-like isoform X2 n=1 Tax=Micropterus dolomieu TaxID=147949 RepID=UPI001E8E560A|nr:mas-related G-protein coupled receptor member A8-like isoform X2 [Micropterus dolomieu]